MQRGQSERAPCLHQSTRARVSVSLFVAVCCKRTPQSTRAHGERAEKGLRDVRIATLARIVLIRVLLTALFRFVAPLRMSYGDLVTLFHFVAPLRMPYGDFVALFHCVRPLRMSYGDLV